MRNSLFIGLAVFASLLLASACALVTADNTSNTESDITTEATESMADSAAGTTQALETDLASLDGTGGSGATTAASIATPVVALNAIATPTAVAASTITISGSLPAMTIAYYKSNGTTWISTDGAAALDHAVLTRSRTYNVTTDKTTGTVTVDASWTVYTPTAATRHVTGTITVTRNVSTISGSRSLQTSVVHTLDWSVTRPTATTYKIASGTATSAATITTANHTYNRNWSWTFNGDGTAVLTTQSGNTVTVTVQVNA